MNIVRFLVAAVAAAALASVAPAASAKPAPPSADPGVGTQIIGGDYVTQSAPWAARLFQNGVGFCSATIIAPRYVLTARHCVNGTLSFRIGSTDADSGGAVAYAENTTVHPNADIAIVRLDRDVRTSYAVLGTTYDVWNGQSGTIYGWGATCHTTTELQCQSRYLKWASVSVYDVATTDYHGGVGIGVTFQSGIGAGGDSGGPLVTNNRQVGVASTSDRQSYGTYTNITRYRSWIKAIAGV